MQPPPPQQQPCLRRSASTSSRRSVASSTGGGGGGESPPPLSKLGSQRSLMSAQEHFTLSAVDKWHRFRLPPWKLLLHLALLAALTAQMLLLHHQDGGAYARAMRRTFEFYFMGKGVDAQMPYVGGPRLLFQNEGFLSSLHQALHGYFHINEVAAVSFAYRNESSAALTLQPQPVRMRLALAADFDAAGSGVRDEYWLAVPGDVGPFSDPNLSPSGLAALLDALLECSLNMVLCNAATRGGGAGRRTTTGIGDGGGARCYCWRLQHRYSFRGGGQAKLTLHQHIDAPCARPPSFGAFLLSDLNAALNLLVAALAAAYLALLCKAIAASVAVFLRARGSFQAHAKAGTAHPLTDRYPTWAAIPWRVKRRFFSTWLLLICLGAALALASALLNLVQRQNYSPSLLSHKACAGAACFLLWASALRYLEPYPKLYALIPVVNAAGARLAPFLAGFVPIGVGYALLGMGVFGRGTVTFGSFSHSFKTLFGMANGDSLHNIIGAARWRDGEGDPLWGGLTLLYFFSYIALAIYVVLNIIIATVAEAYFISRRATRRARRLLRRALRQLDAMEREQHEEQEHRLHPDSPASSSPSASAPPSPRRESSPGGSPPLSPERGGPPFRSGMAGGGGGGGEEHHRPSSERASLALSREPSLSASSLSSSVSVSFSASASAGGWRAAGVKKKKPPKRKRQGGGSTTKAKTRVVRGRSATLHLLHTQESVAEDAFRVLMEMLVEEYRVD